MFAVGKLRGGIGRSTKCCQNTQGYPSLVELGSVPSLLEKLRKATGRPRPREAFAGLLPPGLCKEPSKESMKDGSYKDELLSWIDGGGHPDAKDAATGRTLLHLIALHRGETAYGALWNCGRQCRSNKAAQRQLHAGASLGGSVAGDAFWFAYAPTMGQFHHFMMEWLPSLAFLLASVPVERLAHVSAPRSSSLTSGRAHPHAHPASSARR